MIVIKNDNGWGDDTKITLEDGTPIPDVTHVKIFIDARSQVRAELAFEAVRLDIKAPLVGPVQPLWVRALSWFAALGGRKPGWYACTRCGMSEIEAKAARCDRSPCPMELV